MSFYKKQSQKIDSNDINFYPESQNYRIFVQIFLNTLVFLFFFSTKKYCNNIALISHGLILFPIPLTFYKVDPTFDPKIKQNMKQWFAQKILKVPCYASNKLQYCEEGVKCTGRNGLEQRNFAKMLELMDFLLEQAQIQQNK